MINLSEEGMEERNYLIMPFNNKWYRLKMRFSCTYIHATDNSVQRRCEKVYRCVCSDYGNKNIAIMEIETGKTFIFNG